MVVYTTYTQQALQKWLGLHGSLSPYIFISMENDQEPLTESGLNQLLIRLKKRANVEGRVNPHSFRHNFAREYLRNGGDLVTLARLLGHKDIKTTADYYAIFAPDELAELHEKFSPLKGLIDNL
jgi:integrase/recombinase XerD